MNAKPVARDLYRRAGLPGFLLEPPANIITPAQISVIGHGTKHLRVRELKVEAESRVEFVDGGHGLRANRR